ncbi:dTDP-4-amino-4,6-dideoxygalactose transaminase [Halomonas campaniensis]|uniref:dTDP-4-amino-4,6-dideoxygalactose transaminase n=1 Tax=Halomonas campaniensis TaxID=213554 RepID=A0A7W5K2W3_9GAMM|nr:DegT/DnrJ/EryC1/StrS aminotransferase family protein [Halomonas campaniensis]MBB3330942.1 dTDP-4-amino-4,6-dideoxygalactose transaminase [Halomonas campaniensis]
MEGWPRHEPDELEAVNRVLRSGRVNYWNGEEGRAFEQEFADFHGMPHAIAVANGTLALELALRALQVGEGDEVVVTPRSFMASVSCVVACGGRPVFADVDPDSGNLTAESVAAVLTPRTRAVVAVHLAGWPCDLDALRALCDRHGLFLIEDCAQAHGARWNGKRVGSVGDAAAFSFCTDKIISTGGEGGMLLLKEAAAWSRAWSYKDHGKSWQAVHADHPPGFRWLHGSFGSNWRLTEMQAAIGRCQLGKLDAWLARRRENAGLLADRLAGLAGLRVPVPPPPAVPACYKFYAFVRPEVLRKGWSRDTIVDRITARGGECLHGGCSEIYREQAFDGTDFRPPERLPVARRLGETSLMFLVDHTRTREQVDALAERVREVMEDAVPGSNEYLAMSHRPDPRWHRP